MGQGFLSYIWILAFLGKYSNIFVGFQSVSIEVRINVFCYCPIGYGFRSRAIARVLHGCNSSNFSLWYLTATLNWHIINTCQVFFFFFTFLFFSSVIPNLKSISLPFSFFNQKNLCLNPFSLHCRISMVATNNHRVSYTTTFDDIWCGVLLF